MLACRASVKTVRLFLTWARETEVVNVDDLLARYPLRTGNNKRWMSQLSDGTLLSFREDLKKFDVPTLVIHGDDDQIVSLGVSGKASAAQIKGAKLIVYPGAPHGLTDTHKERFNQDLLDFLKR